MNPLSRRSRARAQIIPLFALGLIAFTAMVGVVLDGGTLLVQRRTAQNAADAAALAGSRALQQATTSPTGTIPFEICKYATANNFGIPPTVSAYFVGTNGTAIAGGSIALPANCSGSVSWTPIPTGAAGVHVDVTFGPYNTYLAGIVGVRQLTASAGATAQVWNMAIDAAYMAPWAVCGPTAPISTSGTLFDVLDEATNTIRPQAYGQSVILQSAKMNAGAAGWLSAPPACPDSNGSSWKGKVAASGTVTPPMMVTTSNGNGSVSAQCTATGQIDPSNPGDCYLFVPITDAHNASGQAHIVTFACMSIYPGGSGNDKWWGTIQPISMCPTYPYKPTWTFGTSSSNTVVALTG